MLVYQRVLLEIFWMARFPPQSPKKSSVSKAKQTCWLVKKNKYLHSAGGHLDFFKRNILIFGSTTVIVPLLVDGIPRFLYPVPSRSYIHLSHPLHHFRILRANYHGIRFLNNTILHFQNSFTQASHQLCCSYNTIIFTKETI